MSIWATIYSVDMEPLTDGVEVVGDADSTGSVQTARVFGDTLLAELEGDDGRKYLRVSTPIGPVAGMDAKRCLRFNWEQRVGFLAVSDLDGAPYLHLCENRPYELLDEKELVRLIDEIGPLGDRLEKAMSSGGDTL